MPLAAIALVHDFRLCTRASELIDVVEKCAPRHGMPVGVAEGHALGVDGQGGSGGYPCAHGNLTPGGIVRRHGRSIRILHSRRSPGCKTLVKVYAAKASKWHVILPNGYPGFSKFIQRTAT